MPKAGQKEESPKEQGGGNGQVPRQRAWWFPESGRRSVSLGGGGGR